MRFIVAVLVAVTSVLAAFSPAHADLADDQLAYVSSMVDGVSLSAFITTANSASHDPSFDWTTDGCSAPLVGSVGRTFDFTNACRRHDFGYRNLKAIEAHFGVDSWNAASKSGVDQRFLSDMRNHCASRGWGSRATCRRWALTFYYAVRAFG